MQRGLEGTVVDGRYVIEEELGRGGMGSVYRGMQVALQRRVAIKVLRADVEHDAVHVERLIREAQALSQIRHPNVVEVIDFGKLDDGSPYIVMEFLDGKDLGVVLQEEGPMPWSRARGILLQVVAGLRAAHKKGVLHRDIKPGNCFLVQDPDAEPGDYVKLVDFGIAKFVTPERTHERRLTQAAYIVGTARYLAPEVYDGADASVQSDIYAVGVLAYKLLTGQAPFIGRDTYDVLLAARNDPPRPMRQLAPDIMPSVERLVLRALAKQPENRFRDTNAFEAAILEVDAGGRRRASGRTGTVVPGSLGATNEQPVLSREEMAQGGQATAPFTPLPGPSDRAPTPWDTRSPATSQAHGRRSSSMLTPIFVSVTIGALAGAAFLVYARWGDTGARVDAEVEPEPVQSDARVRADLEERIRRRCADPATAGTQVQVELGVASSGSIERVRVAAPHDGTELARCIEAIVRDAKFQRGEDREIGLQVTL